MNPMNFKTRENLLTLIQSKIKEQEKYLSHDNEDKKIIKNKQIEELKRILIDLDENGRITTRLFRHQQTKEDFFKILGYD